LAVDIADEGLVDVASADEAARGMLERHLINDRTVYTSDQRMLEMGVSCMRRRRVPSMRTLPGHVCGGVMCGLRELVWVQERDGSRRKLKTWGEVDQGNF
jgi:hypothetical protein